MAKKIRIKIEGIDEATKNINRINEEAKKAIKEEVGSSILRIQDSAKERVPVDTGALRNSIIVNFYGEMSAESVAKMPYAEAVEFGTIKMAAQPYMTPAAEEERPKFKQALEKALRENLK